MIKKYLQKTRDYLLKESLYNYFLYLIILNSFLIICALQLEIIFYFPPYYKQSFFLIIIINLIGMITFWIVYSNNAKGNKIKKYKIESLALKLGKKISYKKNDLVLNALQLETSNEKSESEQLSRSYIDDIYKKLKLFDISLLEKETTKLKLKIVLLSIWIATSIIFFFNYESTSNAFTRLINIKKTFPAPKPFNLLSMSGDIHIIGGETTEVFIQAYPIVPDTLNLQLIPSQVSTKKRDSLKLEFYATPIEDGVFQFKLPELFQDYEYQAIVKSKYFWEAWGLVTSNPDTIFVTDRPQFDNFLITTIPPSYSKLNVSTQEGNIALIEGLKGTIAKVDISSNRLLKNSYLNINDSIINLAVNYNNATGQFKLMNDGEFTVNLVDKRGITNRDPIPYTVNILPDFKPAISVLKPDPITELGNDQIVHIELEVNDDYGFSNLQLAYEVRRPIYLQTDPYVSMFIINDLVKDSLNQKIELNWNLTDMQLMPDDEIYFHFELSDNDNISGPKKTISNNYIIKVPSLADLYENIEEHQSNITSDILSDLEEIEEIKKQFEEMELKMLKTKELDWDKEQSIKNALKKTKDEIKNLDNIAKAMDSITKQADKHKLFSPDLIEKFKELSELVNEILPDEMLNNIENLEESLGNMDLDSIQKALNDLAQNMNKIEEDLDRYLEIFKRFQAEQKLDEISKRMQQLFKQQDAINKEISNASSDKDNLINIAQEEIRNIEELNNILSLSENAAEILEPFSENISEQLLDLINSDLTKETNGALEETKENLMKMNLSNARISSETSLNNIETMMQQMMNIQDNFNQKEIQEMIEKFQNILQDMLYLSSQEEELINSVSQVSRNSPRLRDYAREQQLIQDQLQSVTKEMLKLSNETFAITPDIGRGIGKANSGMENAKSKLTNRNLNQAKNDQAIAMEGLNEASIGLFNSMKNIQESGSASGFEQFLQMMQQMAGKQQGINQQGMQIALGQMAAAAQQQMMQQMLDNQKNVRKSLDQLIKETRHSGQKGMGDLNGIVQEMEEVIKDLQKNKYDRKTQKRQQRILSRILDSQTSMTQRGEKDERKSYTANSTLIFRGPSGLPTDLGQRENLALKALNKALNAGYSKEYQNMIKRYFNALIEIQPDTLYKND